MSRQLAPKSSAGIEFHDCKKTPLPVDETGSGLAVRLSRIIALGGEGQRLSRADAW